MTENFEKKLNELKEYIQKKPEIAMAYIFGSYAKERVMSESDIDIAVYFKPEKNRIEYEENKEYPEESNIWSDVERIVGVNTDFVVMNRCPATLADEILRTGKPIIIKDEGLQLEFFLRVSSVAEDFREFVKDFYAIKHRFASLSENEKNNLIKRVDFLRDELKEIAYFRNLTLSTYQNDKKESRNIERWVESVINATIDIAKIILASEKKKIPDKYQETLLLFGLFIGFDEEVAKKFSRYSELKNILAHEYLDIRFERIKNFIETAEPIYNKLIDFVSKLL